ncbi:hypothetical protein SRABI26_04094 [Arthrobacter sp. Bi26]|nr:hypothetical protein SRABI26_04094 [Arthrobacter sp. Bi26]
MAGTIDSALTKETAADGLAGMMPRVMAPWSELASQPITPTHSPCSDTLCGEVPAPGAQITHRSTA